jgi:hypothetical protein
MLTPEKISRDVHQCGKAILRFGLAIVNVQRDSGDKYIFRFVIGAEVSDAAIPLPYEPNRHASP